ncbi:MAG: FkbM family methyltransferase [Acidobacteria bacterium]|jgi:FkbM family methyltransferase|nr:FkbM family methyltransferase [Acidobacteriota bacterium]
MRQISKILNSVKYRINRLLESPAPSSFEEIERAERIFYLEYLREGMTVFDVGANIGELTLLFSRFIGNGKVHAFEASSTVYKKLELVCGAAERRNVRLNNLALSDKNGTIRLHVYDGAYSSFNSQAARPLKKYGLDIEPIAIEEIAATTVDDYCERENIESIDLLEIDVEGAELQVLRGARNMLRQKRVRCLTFEFGQTTFDMGNRPEEIEDFLKEIDYKIRNIIKGDPIFPGRQSVETARYSMHVATPV